MTLGSQGCFAGADSCTPAPAKRTRIKSGSKLPHSTDACGVIRPTSHNPTVEQWPHAPIHLPTGGGTYFVTAGTYLKQHFFRNRAAVEMLHEALLRLGKEHGWELEAWAVYSNHYHWVGSSPEGAPAVKAFAQHLHSETARVLNEWDAEPGRKVWHQYRDKELTYPKSYFARLNYVMSNPVKHGLVADAKAYPWCSAAWFERTSTPARVKTVRSFKADRIQEEDDFDVVLPAKRNPQKVDSLRSAPVKCLPSGGRKLRFANSIRLASLLPILVVAQAGAKARPEGSRSRKPATAKEQLDVSFLCLLLSIFGLSKVCFLSFSLI